MLNNNLLCRKKLSFIIFGGFCKPGIMKSIISIGLMFVVALAYGVNIDQQMVKKLKNSSARDALFEKGGYIYAKGVYDMGENDTFAIAKQNAVRNAVNDILQYKGSIGSYYYNMFKAMDLNYQGLESVVFSSANMSAVGMITKQVILDEKKAPHYEVYLKAKYESVKGNKPPQFFLKAKINRTSFQSGDLMTLKVKVLQDAYISVFSIDQQGKAYILYPDTWSKSKILKKNINLNLPPSGIKYPVSLPKGQDRATEFLMVIATAHPNFHLDIHTYDDIMKRLVKMQRDEFEYLQIGYVIKKK